MVQTANPTTTAPNIGQIMANAIRQARQGDRSGAYRLALEATRKEPDNVEAWVLRSRLATSNEERLFCLNQVHRLNPRHPIIKQDSYQVIWNMLERDPYLAYIDETDDLYYVRNNSYLSLAVPKDRSTPEVFPPRDPSPVAPAFRWLGWAILAMLVGGFGAFLVVPLALREVWRATRHPLSHADKVRAAIVVVASVALLIVSAFLGGIFLTHITG